MAGNSSSSSRSSSSSSSSSRRRRSSRSRRNSSSVTTQSHLLLAIPFSHYVEKARWAFSYYNVPYTQQLLMPVFHVFGVKPFIKDPSTVRKTSGGGSPFSTPFVVVYDSSGQIKTLLHESHDILVYLSDNFSSSEHVNLYTSCGVENKEKVLALERHYDQVLGVVARRFGYYDMLKLNWWRSLVPFAALGFANRLGLLQSLLWAVFSPAFGYLIAKGMCKGGLQQHEDDEALCRQEFQRASELLSESAYLAGPHLSAADITFAALAYPLLGIRHEAGYSHYPPATSAFTARAIAFKDELRATRAGQHAIRLFAEKKQAEAEAGVECRQKKRLFGLW